MQGNETDKALAGVTESKQVQPIVKMGGVSTAAAEEDEISIGEIIDLLLPHIWKIIGAAILGAVVAFLVTFFLITPQYRATSKIYVVSASNNSVVNLSDLQIGSSLAKDYEELLLVRPLLEDLIDTLGLDTTTQQLASMVTINNPANTRILEISVTSSDPQMSADIANEMVNQACVYLPEVMECEEPNVAEAAVVPTSKVSPSYSRNVLLGALIGLFLVVGIIIVREMLDDSITTPEDVQRLFGTPPLATIPETRMSSRSSGRHRADDNAAMASKSKN